MYITYQSVLEFIKLALSSSTYFGTNRLGAWNDDGLRFVIFWFRRYEKIAIERRLTNGTLTKIHGVLEPMHM